MRKNLFLAVLLLCITGLHLSAQGLKSFTLRNGLSVFIWEDDQQTDVYGAVCVRTGSVNDPVEYTGLAHYLEHVLFKGTDQIGALDWEKEKPIYEQIIAKYDEMAETKDPVKKEAINKEINALTVQQSQLSVSTEFANLLEGIGSKGVNASTSFDQTMFYNRLPASQLNKWLEISSQRFINPVFRAFQSELETVYEEYNLLKDDPNYARVEFLLENMFGSHPYARMVIGYGEHLKNPRLSQLIKFYEDWYVPGNMALVLVGNIRTEDISARINSTFGRLPAKETPERKTYPELEFKGRKQFTKKVGDVPVVYVVYKGVPSGHPDEIPLKITMELISNRNRTGVLDKTTIEGDLMNASTDIIAFREQSRNTIVAVPSFDANQRRFESNRSAEKKILDAVEKVAKGEFDNWLFESVKLNLCRLYDVSMESHNGKANAIIDAFITETDLNHIINYKDEVMAVTIEQVKEIAKKYLNNDYLTIQTEKGKPAKPDKIKKPDFEPIEKINDKQSLYATQFRNMPANKFESKPFNFDDIQSKPVNERSYLYYTPNPTNEIYSMTIRYGVGEREMPKLGIASSLMANAGIMGNLKSAEVKEAFSRLNATCNIWADDDYLTISIYGIESTLPQTCQLLTRQLLMPALDEKQLDQAKSNIIISRMNQNDNPQALAAAFAEYIKYKDKSEYIDALTDKEVYDLTIAELTGDINRAANYQAEIFYTGSMPFDEVHAILSENLPIVANEQQSSSPKDKEPAAVAENTVYFLPNSNVEQAYIYICTPVFPFDKKDVALLDAFNQYFSGSFNGLVLNELREKRSMVYYAGGDFKTPVLAGSTCYFFGEITTQNDKAIDALTTYMDLVRNMPENPDRIGNIKFFLKEFYQTTKPSFREKGSFIQGSKRLGFTNDPALEIVPAVEAMTFDDIVNFYKANLKDKPITIGIMGNPKFITANDLAKFGKVTRITERKLFIDKDRLF